VARDFPLAFLTAADHLLALKRAVTSASRQILEDRATINESPRDSEASADLKVALDVASDWSRRLLSETEATAALVDFIERVEQAESSIRVSLKPPVPSDRGAGVRLVSLSHFVPMKIKKRGVELRIILRGKDDGP
jgi:hypothetical protein